MPPLSERLRERISREGPISFRDFMEAALYDPEDGYYARGPSIGEGGDFVTAPTVTPAFAAVIAREFLRDTAALDGPVDFVEAGADSGAFLADFDTALRRLDPAAASRVRMTAIERSVSARRRILARRFGSAPRMIASAEELPEGSIRGWIFSNELFDALPAVRVAGTPDGMRELRIGVQGGGFVWVEAPADAALAAHLESFGIRLAPGQCAEISRDAAPLYRRLARALARGALVTFDYGHRANVLYHALARPRGTLAVYAAGRRGGDPLERVGEVDLTAHVNWDDLASAGEAEGLTTRGIFRQGRWLAEAGILDFASSDAEKWRIYRLIDPEGMGEELSVLVQSRETRSD
ncbi:MAG TPA: SAM-dependent methyltransferase [Thermoanaerobaculia bacterium]